MRTTETALGIADIRDPETTLTQTLAMSGASLGDILVGHLTLDQQLTDVKKIRHAPFVPRRAGEDPHQAAVRDFTPLSTRLREVAQEMAQPRNFGADHGGMNGILFSVVCRAGRLVTTCQDMRWALGWRYSNHLTGAFSGHVFIVTPHGWLSVVDERAGRAPHLPTGLSSVKAGDAGSGSDDARRR